MPIKNKANPQDQPETAEASAGFWSKRRIGMAGTAALSLLGVWIWYSASSGGQPPAERQQQAIALIEKQNDSPANRRAARKIALDLQAIKYHDPDFPGAAEYILGIAAFRDGLDASEDKRDERFTAAVKYLRDAERLALNAQYRTEWAYALGLSLHALGSPSEARPYVEEALKSSPQDDQELTTKLIEIYLELRTPPLLAKALNHADGLLKKLQAEKAAAKDVDLAMLLKAQVLVALDRTDEAVKALPKLDPREEGHVGIRIIQVQTLLALKTVGGYQRRGNLCSRSKTPAV